MYSQQRIKYDFRDNQDGSTQSRVEPDSCYTTPSVVLEERITTGEERVGGSSVLGGGCFGESIVAGLVEAEALTPGHVW